MAPSPRIPGSLLPPPLSSLTLSSLRRVSQSHATEIEVVHQGDRSEWGFSASVPPSPPSLVNAWAAAFKACNRLSPRNLVPTGEIRLASTSRGSSSARSQRLHRVDSHSATRRRKRRADSGGEQHDRDSGVGRYVGGLHEVQNSHHDASERNRADDSQQQTAADQAQWSTHHSRHDCQGPGAPAQRARQIHVCVA